VSGVDGRAVEDAACDFEERGQRRRGIIGAPDHVGLEPLARLAERESDDACGKVVRNRLRGLAPSAAASRRG
jgi:hypothetical protein